jgi:hypothetical protein
MTETNQNPLDVRNSGKEWSDKDAARLRNLTIGATPLRLIIRELGRPEEELRSKAEEMGMKLESSTDMSRFRFYQQ